MIFICVTVTSIDMILLENYYETTRCSMKKFILFYFIFICFFMGCSSKNMKNYNNVKKNHNNLLSMYQDIYAFDLNNPDFFESKLDLARYYLLIGNYNESMSFLIRAEAIAKKNPKKVSKENEAAMYGCYATLFLINNQIEIAYQYVEKAYNIPKYGKLYGYLLGRILINLDKKEEALKYFESTYNEYPDLITGEEIRSYMYLLGESKNYVKALELLELYFDKGSYFPGLGMFASGIYEKNGQFVKSIFSAFLDYEYQSCFGNADDAKFVQNLNDLRAKILSESQDVESIKAIDFIISLYTGSNANDLETDFFPIKYVELKKIAKTTAWSNKQFNEYIFLEKYFKDFPSFYWNLWEMLPRVNSGDLKNWIPILEKIILLGSSDYYELARTELGILLGLSKNDSQKILLPQQIQQLILIYITNNDIKVLEPIYSFLELPDCDYIVKGYSVIKQNLNNEIFKQTLYKKSKEVEGRLKERLNYILN